MTAKKSAREAVFRLLYRVFSEKLFLDDVFSEETAGLSPTDAAFARRLSMTVLERKTAIDAVLSEKSSVPLRKIKPKILLILESASAEILFLETASYAAVNEAVALTKRIGLSPLSGFVNAVCRAVSRDGKELLQALDPWKRAGIPDFLKSRLCLWYGEKKGLSIAEAMRAGKRTVIRRCRLFAPPEAEFVQLLKKEGAVASKTGLLPDVYYYDGEIPAYRTQCFKKGFFYIQDLSSCLDGAALSDLHLPSGSNEEPFRIYDAASAPGGKLFHVLDILYSNNEGNAKAEAIASDLRKNRTDLIRENLKRMPYEGVSVREEDASEYRKEHDSRYDLVICDLPCSGLGTLKKNPELVYRTDEKSLSEIAALQKEILDNVSRYVRVGGTLLYSTCTINPGENIEQVEAFLRRHPGFSAVSFKSRLPAVLQEQMQDNGSLQVLPDEFPGDGFYIARFVKHSVE